MKKIAVTLFVLAASATAHADRTYECYRYVDGKPAGGFVKVSAASKDEAERKAFQKYKDMGEKVHSVNCH